MDQSFIALVVLLWRSALGSSGQCGHLASLPSVCRCSFDSLVVCEDLRNASVLDGLFQSIELGAFRWMDGVRLRNVRTEAFAGLRKLVAKNVAKIQSFEIENSQLNKLTDTWNGQFWKDHDGTFSLVIRRTLGLSSWNWTSISVAFPSLQYLEIDRSPIGTLPDDFALAFDQLLGLTVVKSNLKVLGQRALYCYMCKSIRLGFNRIENIAISSIATQESSAFHLDLRNNSLTALPVGFFLNMAHVASLSVDLNGNQIEYFEANLFEPLLKAQRVEIRYYGGILQCDCSLKHLAQKPFDIENVSCQKSTNLKADIPLEHFLKTCLNKEDF